MNKVLLSIGLVIASFASNAQDEIKGFWLTPEGNSIVEIDKNEDGKYFGKIVWLKDPNDKKGNPRTDRMNRDKSLRGRPIMGMSILENLDYEGGVWNGTIYVAKKGRKLDAELSTNSSDKLQVKVSVMGMVRTQTFTRSEQPE